MGKSDLRNPRDVDVYEIVEVIEEMLPMVRERERRRAVALVEKLVGPERESEARWSSRHIVADHEYCHELAGSLAISYQEARDFFIGEPIKRVEAVAAWALESADKNFAGLDKNYKPDPESNGAAVHGARGRAVADMLKDWAIQNQTGVYRVRQDTRQATPVAEESV